MDRQRDIFDAIAERDMKPEKKVTNVAKRYQIAYGGTSLVDSKVSRRLYPYNQARRIVARLERRGCPAYLAAMLIRL